MKPGPTSRQDATEFPPYRLDVANGCLWRGTRRISLSVTDGALLAYLSSRPGQLVTHAELLSAIWPGISVTPGVLKVRVRRLRRMLGDRVDRPRFIETVHGRGYRFVAPLTTRPSLPRVASRAPGADTTTVPAPFVGRVAELDLLRRHIDAAFGGERQLVFVTGEPGIGKSALVRELLARVADGETVWIGYGQCVEMHGAGEAYMPVLEALSRACRGPGGRRLQRRLRVRAPSWLTQLPSLPAARDAAARRGTRNGVTSERMVRELAEALDVVTIERPLVLWLEDLHWSDVSTLTLLSALAHRPEPARLLILATYRTAEALASEHPLVEVVRELDAHGRCRSLPLAPLSASDVSIYLATCFYPNDFPGSLGPALHRHTEGHPLFLTRLARDLVARGDVAQVAGRWTLRMSVDGLAGAVPASIRHLVARQRERLSDAEHDVLAAASLVGATFNARLVAAALDRPVADVEDACARLAERELFVRPFGVVRWPDGTRAATYAFLHAVYQALWQERVGPSTRQEWHRLIGERLECVDGEGADTPAAEVAAHFEAAGSDARAIHHLRRAAANALRRSAPHEAIMLGRKALALLERLPQASERAEAEHELRFLLGRLELVRKGYAAPEVLENYTRLRSLCLDSGDASRLFPTLASLVRFHLHRAELDTADRLAAQAFRLAGGSEDRWLAGAHTLLGAVHFNLGRLSSAHDHLRRARSLHNSGLSPTRGRLFGEDIEVPSLAYEALVQWHLGCPDEALQCARTGLRRARALGLPAPLAFALGLAAWLHRLRREPDVARGLATELLATATDHGFPFWIAQGKFELGWALTAAGRDDAGRLLMKEGVELYDATGARMHHVGNAITRMEVTATDGGSPAEALATIADLLSTVEHTGQRYHEPALHRLRGEVLGEMGDHIAADESFQQAVEIAEQQRAQLPHLRAMTSRARLLHRQGRASQARALLQRAYDGFTEGLGTPDLRDARALLRQLSTRGGGVPPRS